MFTPRNPVAACRGREVIGRRNAADAATPVRAQAPARWRTVQADALRQDGRTAGSTTGRIINGQSPAAAKVDKQPAFFKRFRALLLRGSRRRRSGDAHRKAS
jgi:hypothetical protein